MPVSFWPMNREPAWCKSLEIPKKDFTTVSHSLQYSPLVPVQLRTLAPLAIGMISFLMKRVFYGNIILIPSSWMLTSRGLWCRRRRSQGRTVRLRVTSSSWSRGARRSSSASRYPPSFETSPSKKARGRWQSETFGLHSSICLGLTSVLWVEKRILGEEVPRPWLKVYL